MAKLKQTKKTLFQFMNTIITELLKNGQHRTMQHYKTTLNTYTHLGLEDATDELKRMEDLENARNELYKTSGRKQ